MEGGETSATAAAAASILRSPPKQPHQTAGAFARCVFADADKDGDGYVMKADITRYFHTHPEQKQKLSPDGFSWKEFFGHMDLTDTSSPDNWDGNHVGIDAFSRAVAHYYISDRDSRPEQGADSAEEGGRDGCRPSLREACMCLLLAAFLILVTVFCLSGEFTAVLVHMLEAYYDLGWLGGVLLALSLGVCGILLIPGAPLNMGAGFLYGPWIGFLYTIAGTMLGASASFLCGRHYLKTWARAKVANNGLFEQIASALGRTNDDYHTTVVVLLARLPPLFPFPLFSYAFALTDLNFRVFFVASLIGVAPACLLDAYIGSLFSSLRSLVGRNACTRQLVNTTAARPHSPRNASTLRNGTLNQAIPLWERVDDCSTNANEGISDLELIELIVGVVLTLLVTAFLSWYSRKMLKNMSQEEEEGGQSNPRRSRGGVRLAYPEGSPRRRLRLIDTHKATIQDAGHSFHIQAPFREIAMALPLASPVSGALVRLRSQGMFVNMRGTSTERERRVTWGLNESKTISAQYAPIHLDDDGDLDDEDEDEDEDEEAGDERSLLGRSRTAPAGIVFRSRALSSADLAAVDPDLATSGDATSRLPHDVAAATKRRLDAITHGLNAARIEDGPLPPLSPSGLGALNPLLGSSSDECAQEECTGGRVASARLLSRERARSYGDITDMF